jgi:hemerythrin-like domain-containing protein
MRLFVRQIETTGKAPDLKVFCAMLLYISEYPEKVHYPKEDRFLFARLNQRSSAAVALIAELELQHAQGEALVHGLEHALLRYEFLGDSAFPDFAKLVDSYAEFYFRYMKLEEDLILSAANESFSTDDWEGLDPTRLPSDEADLTNLRASHHTAYFSDFVFGVDNLVVVSIGDFFVEGDAKRVPRPKIYLTFLKAIEPGLITDLGLDSQHAVLERPL